jgi:hypothetical protein
MGLKQLTDRCRKHLLDIPPFTHFIPPTLSPFTAHRLLLMARRAKSSFNPLHLLISLAFVAAAAIGGYSLINRGTDGKYTGTEELSLREYLDNSNALSNNTYRIEGLIEDRLDNWSATEGRLFSVLVEQGSEASPLPVLVPDKFNSVNVQRGQRFRFKVMVQAGSGVLQVIELSKA